jgi:predicted NBD/HSP70 family sugar kinase
LIKFVPPARETAHRGRPETLRVINRTAILDALRQHAPISRAELARFTSISAPTVSAIVEVIMAEGLVREVGPGDSGTGRRPTLFALNPNAVHVGVDLSTSGIVRIGLVGLADQLVRVDEIEYETGDASPDAVTELIARYIRDVREADTEGLHVLAIGAGAPGITDVETGVVQWAPALGWREVALAEMLRAQTDLPVRIDNDVNLALIGEVNQGAALQARHALFVLFREGVGGALLADGRLYRGRGGAGEVGYLVSGRVDRDADLSVFGFTEDRLLSVLAEQCARRGIGIHGHARHAEIVAGLLLDEDGALRLDADLHATVVEVVAAALASSAALLDPEAIVLAGWIEALGPSILEELSEHVARLAPAPATLRFSELGPNSVLVGAGLEARRVSTESAVVVRGL